MITINGARISAMPSAEGFTPSALQREIFDIMSASRENYSYDSEHVLITELKVRDSIVNASHDLARSGLSFKIFRDSKANPEFWNRTSEGGFELKAGVSPSDAIADIYARGSLYGTECSTAMIIVLYKALLDVMPRDEYGRLFSSIYLMNWQHLDRDLALVTDRDPVDEIPGDARYFSNPDVDPLRPEWQGENAYYLGGGLYYGHGIGIRNAGEMIRALNRARKKDATRSAYLNEMVKRQDYGQLAKYM